MTFMLEMRYWFCYSNQLSKLEVFMVLRPISAISVLTILFLSACGSSPPPEPLVDLGDPTAVSQTAMNLWRKQQVKGSCSGCHGADFYDLARIGSSDFTIHRRATGDGATENEAKALVQAVRNAREKYQLTAENPLEFRPFQPGGAPLPGNTTIERDIALGRQLQTITPTLMGTQVDSLEKAKAACNEMLAINLRSMPTGIVYPRWSSDAFDGSDMATMNDWVSDIAREPKPENRLEWQALQSAYLENPTDQNFWRMYAAVDSMTQPFAVTAGVDAIHFTDEKFKAALIGQHMLRQEKLANSSFTQGKLAFSYLEKPEWQSIMKTSEFLPGNNLWEVGDHARKVLGNHNNMAGVDVTNARKVLEARGFPKFAVESVNIERSSFIHEEEVRLAWFWIGFTIDPSFARVSGSNSTKVGEYMIGSLLEVNMHLHNTFFTNMRLCAKGLLPEGNFKSTPAFKPDYGYFVGYGREILKWNWDKGDPIIPETQKTEQQSLWHKFTANGFRMSLYLYLDMLEHLDAAGLAKEREWVLGKDGVYGINPATGKTDDRTPWIPMQSHFRFYQAGQESSDTALIAKVTTKLGL
jgi:hypothetical protein